MRTLQMNTWVWHSNGAFLTVLNNCKEYGFTNVTSWGGAGYFGGNTYHPWSAPMSVSSPRFVHELTTRVRLPSVQARSTPSWRRTSPRS